MIKKIFNYQTKTINLAAFILAITSLFSAILGFLRDRLLAFKFGAGEELDIYYAAFRIPDFLTTVFVMGAISASIVPIFSQHLVFSSQKAWRFLANILNLFFFFLLLVSIFLVIFIPKIIIFIVPGFDAEKRELTILLSRIMLFSPFLLGIGNILSSILCIFRRFLIASLTPIVYNLGIIFGILFLFPLFGLQGLAWGVVVGGVLYILIQIPSLFNVGFSFQPVFNFLDPDFKKVIYLTIPRSFGLAAQQINLIFITSLASIISVGTISILNFAESLSRPLLTFVAISFSTAAFPSLSLAFSKKNKEKFFKIFSETFKKIILLSFPLILFYFFFRQIVVEIILKVGAFGDIEARLTAECLGMFLLGLIFQGLSLLLVKTFYSFGDTKTPAFITFLTMFFNIILALSFFYFLSFENYFQLIFSRFLNFNDFKKLQLISLPLSISFSSIFQFIILLFIFKRKSQKIFEN